MTRMPRHESASIADVQSSADTRKIAINRVGIKDIKYPLTIENADGHSRSTVVNVSMYVDLPAEVKGTHMSRFIEILHNQRQPVSTEVFRQILFEVKQKLLSESVYVEFDFPFFVEKKAPVSGVKSYLDYQASFIGEIKNGEASVNIKVIVPVTSLCPCSKKISEYGAHNQRSHVTVNVLADEGVTIEDIINCVEEESSCELFALLKRPDEKFITERAYDNPKFVEDVVRDVASRLNLDDRISEYCVESENFESIHNHSAYACIKKSV